VDAPELGDDKCAMSGEVVERWRFDGSIYRAMCPGCDDLLVATYGSTRPGGERRYKTHVRAEVRGRRTGGHR
jgi:hypothetical protein